jgi:hypothetical protein
MKSDSKKSHEAPGFSFNVPTFPLALAKEVALGGLHLGIGLAVIALDGARKIGSEALERGAKVEKSGREAILSFEREKVAQMKDYLTKKRSSRSSASIEAQVEEALKTFDVPTRDDIKELTKQVHSVSLKVAALAKG